jgi:hypothetical protein
VIFITVTHSAEGYIAVQYESCKKGGGAASNGKMSGFPLVVQSAHFFKEEILMKFFTMTITLVMTAALAMAQMQPVGTSGSVDWGSGTIISKGIGASNPKDPIAVQRAGALRVAKLDALRNALETFKGINLNSETTVNNFVATNDMIRTKVEGFVKGFEIAENGIHYMSDGSVEVEVKIPLSGILTSAPELLFGSAAAGAVCPTCGQPWPAGRPLPQGMAAGTRTFPTYTGGKGTVFTGLVIDAKGLGIMPAMAPKILDEDGKEVYGSAYVSKEFAISQGMVGYAKDVKKAAELDRVKDKAGVVKALRASGKNKTDIVIANKDAADILAAKENMNFLQKCKVVIVVD